jgi:hypothetical protein
MSKLTKALAGSRRFWVVVLFFAIANAGVWVAYDRWQKSHRHAVLEVTQFTPGEGAVVEGRAALCWTFNLDVAPPKPGSPPPGVISPNVEGKWQWEDARTLKFTPDAPLPRATPIKVTLNSDVMRTPDGFRMARAHVSSVSTAALTVLSARQVEFDDADRVVVEMTFSDKVSTTDVQRHLSLRGPDGRGIPFQPHGQMAGRTVRVITDSLAPYTAANRDGSALSINLNISKGLAGESGPLGMPSDYRAQLSVAADLLATSASAYFPSNNEEPFIQIRFNNPVRPEAIQPTLSVVPPVPFTLSGGYRGIHLHGPFKPSTHYLVKISRPAFNGTLSKNLPRSASFAVLMPDREPGLWFESEVGYLSAEGNRTVLAHAVNHTDLTATVTRIYDNNLVAWRNSSRQGYWKEIESFSRPVAVRKFHLPSKKNEKQDIRLSLDDLLPAGEARDGVYQISLRGTDGETENRSPRPDDDESEESDDYRYGGVSTMVTLSDIAISAKLAHGGITVWTTSLRTAKPLAGVHLRLFSNKSQLLGDAISEAGGLATIIPVAAAPGEKPAVLIAEQQVSVEVRDEGKEGNAADEARKAGHRQAAALISTGRGLTWLDLRDSAVNFGDADTAGRPYLRSGYEAFVYTDRGVYRPGETVHLRAIVRGPDNAMPQRFPIRWQIRRPDLHDWKAQMAEIDADGATSFDLPLPADLPSGRWTAHVGLPGNAGTSPKFFGSIAFEIEDFMPQRMKVSVDFDGIAEKGTGKGGNRIPLTDAPIAASVQADYLFGRPVAERPATLVARIDPVPFRPAGLRDWTFGDQANTAEADGHRKTLGRRLELPEATLDAKGHAKWDVKVKDLLENGETEEVEPGDGPIPVAIPAAAHIRGQHRARKKQHDAKSKEPAEYAGPWRLSVTGSVIETGGRAVTAGRQVDLDSVPYYIGVKLRETSPRPRVASTFDVQLITPAGKLAAAFPKLQYTLLRETWNSSYVYEHDRYRFQSTRILETVGDGDIETKIQNGRGQITITPPTGGSYVLLVRDPQTECITSLGFYAGYGAWEDNISRQNPERLELLVQPTPDEGIVDAALQAIHTADLHKLLAAADRAAAAHTGKLRVGQSAQVIVRSPFAGRLLLSVENDGVISTQVLDMPANHITAKIDITDACRPNAYVTATVVRPIDPNAKWTIHRAIGVTRLSVDNSDRRLNVAVAVPAEIRPETSLGADVHVTDSAGHIVPNAAVTVAAVDEGICRLTDFQTPDPFNWFMAHRALAVHNADLFGQLMPETPKAGKQSAVGGDDDTAFGMKRGSPVGARRVKPVALVSAVLHTNAQGVAHADFATPQFTGQLRVMAVVSAERSFGSADSPVLVRSPLLVQSSWPRFAAPGDRFSVPLAVFNNGTGAGSATVTLELNDVGPLRFAANNGTKLSLPPIALEGGGQKTTAFDVVALDSIGVAHARLVATMNGETYEESVELPIRPASPTVTAGGYLTAKLGAPATVEIPAGFVDGTIKFELRANAMPSLQLPEGLDYLDRYPHGCVEQTTSTLFPLVYFNDIDQQIMPGLFDKSRVADKVRIGMLRLLSMQTSDGGLAMWPGERADWPWGSVYAAHFLVEAQAAGYDVPEDLRDPLMIYVRGLLNRPEDGPDTVELQAYAAYVMAMAGKPQRAVMGRLSEVVRLTEAGSARFHLAAAWLAAGRRDVAAGLIPAAIPAPRSSREQSGNIGSPIRDRAILVSTMLGVIPQDPRIPALVQQLAEAGRKGQWRSTQDTAFAVMAIGRYLRHAKAQTPYQNVELFLDGQPVASSTGGKPLLWTAASLDEHMSHERAPGAAKLPAAGKKLQIRVTGAAASSANIAWLETGVRTTPPASADSGMTIRRRYLDEHGKPLAAMRVHSGDLVQVELTVQAAGPIDLAVIEDLLPAGLEIENPRLAGNAAGVVLKAPQRHRHTDQGDGPVVPVFEPIRSDMRDDRLILVGNLSAAGSATYVYTARAVTPGKYVLPPVKGECMYDSGVNSLWGAGMFEVVPLGGVKVARLGE